MWQKYVAIGDSITEGYGDSVPGLAVRSWADWVADVLASLHPEFSYTNLGRRGSITADVLRDQLPAALEAKPDLVSITVGANDARLPEWTVDSFRQSFVQLVQPFADRGTTIITTAYPDIAPALAQNGHDIPPTWQLYFQRLAAANVVIRQVSEEADACLLDFESFAPFQDPAHISGDLIHPNALGYKLAADVALQRLAERFDLSLREAS